MKWEGTVSSIFDGTLFGFQAGQDLVGWESDGGHRDRVGLLVGYARMNGDLKGQALGWNDLAVGEIDADSTSLGGYWTSISVRTAGIWTASSWGPGSAAIQDRWQASASISTGPV